MANVTTRKVERLNVRITPEQKQLLEAAARLRQQSLSTFVLEEAVQGAQAVLADQTQFVLSEAAWAELAAALDRPPRPLPKLKALLTEPPVSE